MNLVFGYLTVGMSRWSYIAKREMNTDLGDNTVKHDYRTTNRCYKVILSGARI